MKTATLKIFAEDEGIFIKGQKEIALEARDSIAKKYNYNTEQIKDNFDALLQETELKAYEIYLNYELNYGKAVLKAYIDSLIKDNKIKTAKELAPLIGGSFNLLDKFFLSLAQSRKSRAGKSFEEIHNSLFKILNYPFDEQVVINGKPDFLMPSAGHYRENPMDCIIFTAKRTLRERWRQIVTEGTRGLGFFLATIDDKISANQLNEMLNHRIYIVCPEAIKNSSEVYKSHVNVLSFRQFFRDHLDPKLKSWKRNKIIK